MTERICDICHTKSAQLHVNIAPWILNPTQQVTAGRLFCHVCNDCYKEHGRVNGIQDLARQNKIQYAQSEQDELASAFGLLSQT